MYAFTIWPTIFLDILYEKEQTGAMLLKRPQQIPSSEITPEHVYVNRRQFLAVAALAAGNSVVPGSAYAAGKYDTNEKQSPLKVVTTYNNYYEFGTGKDEPALNIGNFKTRPWTVAVEGLLKRPAVYAIEDLLKGISMETRVYRMRCVEAWSMVIPWFGFPLATLINRLEPLPSAKYIEMETLYAPDRMPGQKRSVLNWPYREGLRMDEAMNELTLLATGVYGKEGPAQNGAPLRLVMPWIGSPVWLLQTRSFARLDLLLLRSRNQATRCSPASIMATGDVSSLSRGISRDNWSEIGRIGGRRLRSQGVSSPLEFLSERQDFINCATGPSVSACSMNMAHTWK